MPRQPTPIQLGVGGSQHTPDLITCDKVFITIHMYIYIICSHLWLVGKREIHDSGILHVLFVHVNINIPSNWHWAASEGGNVDEMAPPVECCVLGVLQYQVISLAYLYTRIIHCTSYVPIIYRDWSLSCNGEVYNTGRSHLLPIYI